MRRVFGPRTVVEAAFLVAVPVVTAAISSGGWQTIVAASAVAYLLIVLVEATLGRKTAPGRARIRIPKRSPLVKRKSDRAAAPEPDATSVLPPIEESGLVEVAVVAVTEPLTEPAAALEPEPVTVVPEPEPEPEPEPTPQAKPKPVTAAPEPSFTAKTPSEHVRVLRVEPDPEPEPEPVAERPQLAAVPEPEPEPVAAALAATDPPEAPSTVVPIGIGAGPRQWNLWDLERLTREHSGRDVAQDEERQFLLMYLREFADSAGLLPLDFDGLVRDSFGELVGAR
jgi:hypothetical protein